MYIYAFMYIYDLLSVVPHNYKKYIIQVELILFGDN